MHQPTEAIVNPANVDLLHGGGAARAIASADEVTARNNGEDSQTENNIAGTTGNVNDRNHANALDADLKQDKASVKLQRHRVLKKDEPNMGNDRESSHIKDDNGAAIDATTSTADDDANATASADSRQDADSPRQSRALKKKDDDCVICLEPITDAKQLDCGHRFCIECIAEYFEKGQPKCPSCGKLYGMLKGNQPRGGMFSCRCIQRLKLAGYQHHGALEITYHIPNGIQTVSIVFRAF